MSSAPPPNLLDRPASPRSDQHGSAPERRVLVVDDDEEMCELLEVTLRKGGVSAESCTSEREALALVASRDFDVVLTDLGMAAMGESELCGRILAIRPEMPVVVVTGDASQSAAVGAIRAGAYDFVTKPVDADLLQLVVARAIQHSELRHEVTRLRTTAAATPHFGNLLGESIVMKRLFDLLARVVDSDASVLVTGESGTGKELIARALHDHGPRRRGPYLAVNCAAMPAALLESELFGHTRGAFTDAKSARAGLFVQANRGTLFLDEIGEMPVEMQAKLLRALQERTVRPVGSNEEIPFDARIVTATNRDLEADVLARRFREDLFYRINVVRLDAPALRDRAQDILLLAQHFVDRFSKRSQKPVKGIHATAAERLLAYEWPGNVRELENCMERAVALLRFDEVTVDDLPAKVRRIRDERVVFSVEEASEVLTLAELERRYIHRVVAVVRGNKSRAAELLGLDRRTLYRRLKHYGTASGGSDET